MKWTTGTIIIMFIYCTAQKYVTYRVTEEIIFLIYHEGGKPHIMW